MLKSLFNKVANLLACNVIKKRLQRRCFPANIGKSLRTPIFKIICEQLLLPLEVFCEEFVDISYGNASSGILEDSIWLELTLIFAAIYFRERQVFERFASTYFWRMASFWKFRVYKFQVQRKKNRKKTAESRDIRLLFLPTSTERWENCCYWWY